MLSALIDDGQLVGLSVVAEQLAILWLISAHGDCSKCHMHTLNALIFFSKDRTFNLIVITEHHNGIERGHAHLGIVEVTIEVEV